MKDKTPPGYGGVSVHSGEPNPSTTPPINRNVLSLADARRRREGRELSPSLGNNCPDEDGAPPPRAA